MDADRRIIALLAEGDFVSGERIASALGVSRAAVHQHLARLREQGVGVDSVRGRGYRLHTPLEPLSADRLRDALTDAARARLRRIDVLGEVDSTNRYLRDHDADACFAEYQSAGRGRRGRQWLAAPFASILCSVAHQLPGGPAASAGLSLVAGVAAARAVAAAGADGIGLKWPNDLVLGGAKCGGILVEIAGELGERCRCIVGVGLNLAMPEALAARCGQPVSALADHVTEPLSRNGLAATLVSQLVEALAVFNEEGFSAFREEWIARHVHQRKDVTVAVGDAILRGTAVGVEADGALLLAEEGGQVRRVTTGEVMA